ncbi:hypothetical protein F5B22DRAFT_626932 [Xylaria bambusicola]|uniref:uncharacterized protein n=1 Tax=Xylaria bambusicola TaxID=326684 RepID=UPI002007E6AB|nr:uncharacterized protein F5B22DRAFT_626932 [Xylaria bambusicola]KAI0505697.1 hypothetical protein F5B22DRAFT_626932 [Xylaria bambusicola]
MARPSYRTYGSPAYSAAHHDPGASIWDEIMAAGTSLVRRLRAYGNGRGRHSAWKLAVRGGHQLRRNLVRRRLLSFPHLLVALWVFVLLWGERWTFASKVNSCDWDHWEDWPPSATPHRLVFVADPQIIDPHSYPGRPWPLNPLTMRITDNYMSRSYTQVQKILHPDTVMFLGDLFDGGREWKTAHGDFADPEWAKDHRPADEKKYVKQWNRKYGEKYWLKEYARFGRIFFDKWIWGGTTSGPHQRGRKLIASLPGNHDLGFGAEVKLPVRHRFNAYFGETNRVDVIGNHTFVSVDTVSLSADTSNMKNQVDLGQIYGPVNDFLDEVKARKRRAVQKELRFWRGDVEEVVLEHKVEELEDADYSNLPTMDPGEGASDFPTILLTHVPLYRERGTPCGPMREHWPPTNPPKGQTGPVIPDHRNAISVSGGYQYQNVLSDEDSIKLIKSIGNVIHVFSGDDHDYCEVVHSPEKENVREITVKSFSMAMGVPTPGFQMVSLYNPVDDQGKPLPSSTGRTMQTHLCLLPNQLSMFLTYAILGVLTILVLVARAFLVPLLNLQPFALEPMHHPPSAVLPVFKAKMDADDDYDALHNDSTSSSGTASNNLPLARFSSTRTRDQWQGQQARNGTPPTTKNGGGGNKKTGATGGKWGWAQNKGPKIQIRRDNTYFDGDDDKMAWRPASSYSGLSGRRRRNTTAAFRVVLAEMWTTCWRTAWMVLLFYAWLTWRG